MTANIVDYVWIGGNGELRSKIRILRGSIKDVSDIPEWNYDGSSTDQADGSSSEIFIRPCYLVKCPFNRTENSFIVLCSTYDNKGNPAKYNNRDNALKIFNKYESEIPWYGLEQEYFIYDAEKNYPLGFQNAVCQGQYYCSVGGNNAFGRDIVQEHLEACLYAGIYVSGVNAEVAPGQWEFQIGPVEGINTADQLWIARYILEKITEKYNAYIVYHPKPLKGNWNGSGCHTNFSTKKMRNPGGMEIILASMKKLEKNHDKHMEVYGAYNKERMTGKHETSSYDKFTYGVANRNCSVRIPTDTYKNGFGYFEDRRSASNCDPYLVTSIILETIMN